MLCKKESKGIPLSVEQNEWLQDTNEEPDEQELEAHTCTWKKFRRQHSKQPESINDTYVVEMVDSNVIPDSKDTCYNEEKANINAEEPENERVLLASLITNLKLDVDENKKIQKQLKKANISLTQELDKYKLDLKYCKIKLERNKTFHQKDKEEAELKCKEALDLLAFVVHDLLIPLAHKPLKSVGIFENYLKEEMLEDLKYVKPVEKKVDDLKMKIDDLKSQLEHEKTDLPKVDDLHLQEFKIKECERLENELSKSHKQKHDKSFAQLEKHWNNEKVLKAKNDSLIAELNRKTIEINDLKAQLQDKTIVNAEMRALLNKAKEKSVDTKFVKPYVVKQPNSFKFQKPLVLGKPSPFANSFERQSFPKSWFVPKTHEKKDLSKPVTPQILPQN
ncbi:hypothetical protein Tco_1181949 [Tanacetum coccineum]